MGDQAEYLPFLAAPASGASEDLLFVEIRTADSSLRSE
jgi:hypothetical protein